MALLKKKKAETKKMDSIEDKIAKTIRDIENLYDSCFDEEHVIQLSKLTYTFCLGAVSATRKMPGIDHHMGFEKLYQCPDEASKEIVRFNLLKMYQIQDFKSLLEAGNHVFSSGRDYDQFYAFWNNEAPFDLAQLSPEAKSIFMQCKSFARYFYPYLKEQGMYAWDYNERIGLLRTAYACDLITLQQFNDLSSEIVQKALQKYHNWKEYAISCLCGATYFMFKSSLKIEDAMRFLELNQTIITHLMKEDHVWTETSWGYQMKKAK